LNVLPAVLEPTVAWIMSKRIIIGSLLLMGGFFSAYHAFKTLNGWQYRNRTAFGVTDLLPYFEIALALLMGIVALWLLFKKPSA
jgi:hypothetical protein